MKPYIADASRDERHPPPTRLIGFEIRVRRPDGCQEEVRMVELDIELDPCWPGSNWRLPCTLHTSRGDVNCELVVP